MTEAERAKQFNKENYKIVKVYIDKEIYPLINNHVKQKNKKMSGYIIELILKDIGEDILKKATISHDSRKP